jgi:hypothetical protein
LYILIDLKKLCVFGHSNRNDGSGESKWTHELADWKTNHWICPTELAVFDSDLLCQNFISQKVIYVRPFQLNQYRWSDISFLITHHQFIS